MWNQEKLIHMQPVLSSWSERSTQSQSSNHSYRKCVSEALKSWNTVSEHWQLRNMFLELQLVRNSVEKCFWQGRNTFLNQKRTISDWSHAQNCRMHDSHCHSLLSFGLDLEPCRQPSLHFLQPSAFSLQPSSTSPALSFSPLQAISWIGTIFCMYYHCCTKS